MCAVYNTDPKKNIICHMSHVPYHLSLMQTATDPHPSYSPTMHNRLNAKIQKHKKLEKTPKIIKTLKKKGVVSFTILAILSLTRSLQLCGFRALTEGFFLYNFFKKDIVSTRLNQARSWFNENSDRDKIDLWVLTFKYDHFQNSSKQ